MEHDLDLLRRKPPEHCSEGIHDGTGMSTDNGVAIEATIALEDL